MRAAAAGRWADCLRDLKKAQELKIDEDLVRDQLQAALLATGSAKTMVTEYRARLASNPLDVKTMVLLIEMMAAVGPAEPIEKELTAWANRLPMEVRSQVVPALRAIAAYDSGKMAECEKLCRQSGSLPIPGLRLHAVLAQKRAKEATLDPEFSALWEDPWQLLAVSVGLALEGQKDEAIQWREKAILKLEALGTEMRLAAKILKSPEPPGMTEIARVLVGSGNQALLCASLAQRFPAKRAEYQAAAARYNVRRTHPYQLVLRAIESTATAAR